MSNGGVKLSKITSFMDDQPLNLNRLILLMANWKKLCIDYVIHCYLLDWGDARRAEQYFVKFGTSLANVLLRQFHSDANSRPSAAKSGKNSTWSWNFVIINALLIHIYFPRLLNAQLPAHEHECEFQEINCPVYGCRIRYEISFFNVKWKHQL